MNKVILFSILISTLLLGAFYTYNSTSQEVQTHRKSIFNRAGMKKHIVHHTSLNLQSTDAEELNILTYRVNIGLGVQENNKEQNVQSTQKTEVNTIAHVQVDYVPENNIYELVLAYSKYNQETYLDDVNVEKLIDYEKIRDQKSFVQNSALLYKVYVDEESGEILNMFVPENMDSNDMMQWCTEELVNNIFPDIRSQSYLENTPEEEDSIGQFKPHLKETITSDNLIQLEKHYDTKDYTQYALKDGVVPEVDFNRTLIIDSKTGIVQGGQAAYEYSIGQNDETDSQVISEDGETTLNLDINSMNIEIESNFHLLSEDNYTKKQSEQLLKFLQNNDYKFQEIQLSKFNKGKDKMEEEEDLDQMEEEFNFDDEIEEEKKEFFEQNNIDYTYFTNDDDIEDEEEENDQMDIENKLTSSHIHQEKKNIVKFNIFKQNVDVRAYVTIYDTKTNFKVALRVKEKIIRDFYNRNIDHCKNYSKTTGRNIKKTIFNQEYYVKPMVTLKLNVQAEASVNLSITTKKKSSSCNIDIRSLMFATLKGSASPAVAGILSAGVYVKGTFLKTTLIFDNDVSLSKKSLNVELRSLFQPAKIEFGVTYKLLIDLLSKSHKIYSKTFKTKFGNTSIFKKSLKLK